MVLLVILLFLMVEGSFTSKAGMRQGRIIGGYEATPHSHPYLVSLQLRIFMLRAHFCGGTILNERWILSAAHCIQDSWYMRWIPVDAVAGAHDVAHLGPEAQISAINKSIKHPHYAGGASPNDIALLKVSNPFLFTKEIKPAMLPTSNYKIKGNQMTLTGWGALKTTLFIPAFPSKLQEVEVTYIPANECLKINENLNELYEDNAVLDSVANICTGPITGGIAACEGDSGGPLVQYVPKTKLNTPHNAVDKELKANRKQKQYKDQENIPIVIGVVSWGVSPCGEKGAPTVYTKVSNYLDFIGQYIET